MVYPISMALCKTAVTPLLMHWSYCSFALSHRYALFVYTIFVHGLFGCSFIKIHLVDSRDIFIHIFRVHDDVIKWKHSPRYWPFVRGIHRSPVNSPHKGQWREALMFSLIWAWMNCWVNNREVGDLRRHRAHYDVTVMCWGRRMITPDERG